MIIERIWTANTWRSFNYLIVCPESGEALAVDPLDHAKCLASANRHGWRITQILNTHEHYDHTGGNDAMMAATGAKLLAHKNAAPNIPHMDRGLAAGDRVKVGRTVELECLDTPGHTMAHVCLFSRTHRPVLISGDTLFSAGAGNCHNGGHPHELYKTFSCQLSMLPDDTLIYPGHDYMARNLSFTIDREPDNEPARCLAAHIESQIPSERTVTTLALEKRINTFFRLDSPALIKRLREAVPDLPERPGPKLVFLALRTLRNKW